jgi:hypothetical protein
VATHAGLCQVDEMAGPEVACESQGDVVSVARAMLRYLLPRAASGLCLRVTWSGDGVSLCVTYSVRETGSWPGENQEQAAADLSLIDSAAARWGQCGNACTQWLWAVLPPNAVGA